MDFWHSLSPPLMNIPTLANSHRLESWDTLKGGQFLDDGSNIELLIGKTNYEVMCGGDAMKGYV